MKFKKILITSAAISLFALSVSGTTLPLISYSQKKNVHQIIKQEFLDQIKTISNSDKNHNVNTLKNNLLEFVNEFDKKDICESIDIEFDKNPYKLLNTVFVKITKINIKLKKDKFDMEIDKSIEHFVRFDKESSILIFDFFKNPIPTKIYGKLCVLNLDDPSLVKNNVLIIPSNALILKGSAPTNITKVFFSNGCQIEEIPKNAFKGCKQLNQVVFNEDSKIKIIDSGAFKDTWSLKSILLPKTLKQINSFAFQNSGINSITIPEGVKEIHNCSFYNCQSLNSISLPSTLEFLDDWAFGNGPNIQNINIESLATNYFSPKTFVNYSNNNITKYVNITTSKYSKVDTKELFRILKRVSGDHETKYCIKCNDGNWEERTINLEDSQFIKNGVLTIPSNVSFLEGRAPKNITKLIFEDGCLVQRTPKGSFTHCSSLSKIDFGKNSNLTTIDTYSFDNCTSLKNLNLPNSINIIGWYAFLNCNNLNSISFPKGLQHIYNSAFYNCDNLKSITFPSTLTMLDKWAFANGSTKQNFIFEKLPTQFDALSLINDNNPNLKEVTCVFKRNTIADCKKIFDSLIRNNNDFKTKYIFQCIDGNLEDKNSTNF